MSHERSLDGNGWQVRGCLGGSWRWYMGPDKPWDGPGWYPARVPGSVVDDLWRAGEVQNPYFERNTLLLEWVPERAWVYRRWLETPPLGAGELATLWFEGVDFRATVVVDGEPVATHEGMFVPFEVDVSAALGSGGQHLLAVVVHPAPENEPQVGDTAHVRVHKSRMSYG
jgi:beta-mannosidase